MTDRRTSQCQSNNHRFLRCSPTDWLPRREHSLRLPDCTTRSLPLCSRMQLTMAAYVSSEFYQKKGRGAFFHVGSARSSLALAYAAPRCKRAARWKAGACSDRCRSRQRSLRAAQKVSCHDLPRYPAKHPRIPAPCSRLFRVCRCGTSISRAWRRDTPWLTGACTARVDLP